MYSLIQLKTLVCGRDPARSLPLRRGFLLIPLVLICFGLLSRAQAQEGDIGGGNTVEGFHALNSSTVTGGFNTGLGWYSGGFITDAFFNTAVGAGSLDLNNGNSNTAAGTGAMLLNITANNNTAVGTDALLFNDFTVTSPSTANDNTALGFQALFNNHDAGNNTAVGSGALFNNDSVGTLPATAFDNTAVGVEALFSNTDGLFNNAVGAFALLFNTTGFGNNAFGESALFFNGTPAQNTAIGDVALAFNDFSGAGTANNNTAVGGAALFNNDGGSENTAVGTGSGQNLVSGFNNTYLGDFVGTLAPDESSTIRIGDLSNGNGAGSLACFIGGIWFNFQPVGGSVVEVTLDLANDKLGWDVGPNQSAPSVPSRGAPARRSAPGAPAQRPTEHQAMLNDKVEKLQVVVQLQQKQIVTLTAQLKEQAAQIQKVSAQVEMVRSAPQVVENR